MAARSFLTFVAGIAIALAIPALGRTPIFQDVSEGEFYTNSLNELVSRGVIRGYGDGRFGPNDTVTRAQLAVVLNRYDRTVIDPLRNEIQLIRQKLQLGQCADKTVQPGETCDDGNKISGDGCSRDCQKEGILVPVCDASTIGETFPSSDGCNTCTCTKTGIACTEKACAPTDSENKRCYSSNDCAEGQFCTTEEGDCQSACEPGAEACIQVCAGVCKEKPGAGTSCADYVCRDGSRHPSCTADGHPIMYFAAPCLTHGGEVSGPGGVNSSPISQSSRSSVRSSSSLNAQASSSGVMPQACQREFSAFEDTVTMNMSCTKDTDCVLFEASCPFVTCGVAMNKSGQAQAKSAADAILACQQKSGEPVACATCLAQKVRCSSGQCIAEPQR